MLRYCKFFEPSMRTSCYATVSSLELSTHASCYATVSSLELSMHTSCYATVRSLELSMHASCYSTVRSLELSMHASCYACRFSWSFHSCVMLRYCRYSWTFHSCVKSWRKTCHVELVSELAKKMLVSSRRNACFEKLHQNKGLTALNITSNKFLFARAHQIWSMTPRWSQKTHGLLEAVLLVSSCRQNPSKPCWLIPVEFLRHNQKASVWLRRTLFHSSNRHSSWKQILRRLESAICPLNW